MLLEGYVKADTTNECAIVEQPSTSIIPDGIFVEFCLVTLPKKSLHKLTVWVRNENEHDVTLPSSGVIAELHAPEQIYDNLPNSDKKTDAVKCCAVASQPTVDPTRSHI